LYKICAFILVLVVHSAFYIAFHILYSLSDYHALYLALVDKSNCICWWFWDI